MANHGFVKTRRFMTPEKICAVLDRLNKTHFKGGIRYKHQPAEDGCIHHWNLWYESDGEEWALRSFWLTTSRSFEIRHSGGSDFAWWIDFVITNEIALEFNGTITDDGCDMREKGKINYLPTFEDAAKMMMEHLNPNVHGYFLQVKMKYAPIEHRVHTGPKKTLKYEIVDDKIVYTITEEEPEQDNYVDQPFGTHSNAR